MKLLNSTSKKVTINHKQWQKGIALVITLVLLTSMTLVGVSSVSSGVMQMKMATNQNSLSLAFDAAEASIEGIIHESSSSSLRAGEVLDENDNQLLDVLTAARAAGNIANNNQIDVNNIPTCDETDANWQERSVTSAGLQDDSVHTTVAAMSDKPEVWAWSKSAYLGMKNMTDINSGLVSSVVDTDGSRNRTVLEVFVIKGCGHVSGAAVNVANTLIISRQAIELQE